MPNRYEREIEEILRNLEQTEPKVGIGQKFSDRLRRKPAPRMRQRRDVSFHLTGSEWLLVTAIVIALIAGGYAYLASTSISDGANMVTGILAIAGFVCILLVACSQFMSRPGRQSTRYGNVTITPLRRGPFNALKTRWDLFMLKMRYRRRNTH